MSGKVTDKRSIRREKTRTSIKEAALEIARREGWTGVTIRKIADTIDYTAPIVYEHFKNKDDLYHQLVHDGFRELSDRTMDAVRELEDSREKLIVMAKVRFTFALEKPTLHHMMFDTENPQWQQVEMARSMLKIKSLVDTLLRELSADKSRVMEYTLNLICLIKGYTFFANHLLTSETKMATYFPAEREKLTGLFLEAVKRFIQSIQNP